MPTFLYTARSGKCLTQGCTDAENVEFLKERLEAQGYHLIDVEPWIRLTGEQLQVLFDLLTFLGQGPQSLSDLRRLPISGFDDYLFVAKHKKYINIATKGKTHQLISLSRAGKKFLGACEKVHLVVLNYYKIPSIDHDKIKDAIHNFRKELHDTLSVFSNMPTRTRHIVIGESVK